MRSALATVVLLGVGVAPAAADPVSITAACQATRDALNVAGTVTGGAGEVVFAGQRWRTGYRVVDPSGTYGILAGEGLRTKDRKAALRYLKARKATAWFKSGSTVEARANAIGLPADCASAAGVFLNRSGNTYQYANVTVTLDDESRILTWTGTTDRTFSYIAQTVDLPTPVVSYARWERASQAASLNATMRTIARTVAASVSADATVIAATLRTYADPARAVPLKVRTLRAGGLLYGRNPFTHTYHAWRVYVKEGTLRAKRVAP